MEEATIKTTTAAAVSIGTFLFGVWRAAKLLSRILSGKAAVAGREEARKIVDDLREDVMKVIDDHPRIAALGARTSGVEARLARTEKQIDDGFSEMRRKIDDVHESIIEALRSR